MKAVKCPVKAHLEFKLLKTTYFFNKKINYLFCSIKN